MLTYLSIVTPPAAAVPWQVLAAGLVGSFVGIVGLVGVWKIRRRG